jgi:hypothetical protein
MWPGFKLPETAREYIDPFKFAAKNPLVMKAAANQVVLSKALDRLNEVRREAERQREEEKLRQQADKDMEDETDQHIPR